MAAPDTSAALLPPNPAIDALVLRDQVLGLYAQERRSRPIGWALLVGMLLVFGRQAGPLLSSAWCALLGSAMVLGHRRQRGFARAVASGTWDPEHWARRNRWGVAYSAAALGAAMWFFYRDEQGDLRYLLLMMLLATAAGSINAYGHEARSMRACLLGMAAPMLAWMLILGLQRRAGVVGALLFVFYIGMLLRFGQSHARLLADSLRMRHEQRDLVAQLQRKTAEAEAAAQAKSAFFAAASHDLRQPLQAMTWYAGLLGQPDAPPQLAQRLRDSIAALGGLFDGILGIARLDAGKLQAQPQPVHLATLVGRVVPQFAGQADAQGLRLRWRVPATAVVHTDPVLLERMLGNLLSNALRYTPRGGVLVGARQRGAQWWLQVWDTGIGIAPADQQRVFDEFVQLGNPQRDAAQGVGLGLPTTRRLADLLGHGLQLQSQPGRGSCFTLVMDSSTLPPEPAAAAPPEAPADALHGRVLLVDDDAQVREALQWTLQRWGLRCDTAGTAADALALAGQHRYQVLLCDQRLPDGEGTALLRSLQVAQPDVALAAVISGDALPPSWTDGAVPAPLWLAKPVKPMQLRALLTQALAAPAA
jgi:signal transduction histidine kinase/CheY-like chemotaxis protein